MGNPQQVEANDQRQRLWNLGFWGSLMMFEIVGWLLTYRA
jgi:hypothetical protein